MKRRSFVKYMLFTPALLSAMQGCGSSGFENSQSQMPVGSSGSIPVQAVITPIQARELVLARGALLLAADSVKETPRPAILGGATRIDVDELTSFSESPAAFDNVGGFQERFRSWGVRAGTPIVIYDNGTMKFAARVHFLLSHFGAPQSYIVNGGSPAIVGLSGKAGGTATISGFVAKVVNEPISLVFQDDVLAALGTATKIIDVRSPAEFNGQLLLPGDARPGHIPGASNLPESRFFGVNGLLLNNASLMDVFQGAGLTPDDDIIVYCHDGAKSSLAATLLVQTGFPRTSLYYLSYRNWSENFALPVDL
jgi:thiosulfate/3-mercaptopyruvate sulfurtransferase